MQLQSKKLNTLWVLLEHTCTQTDRQTDTDTDTDRQTDRQTDREALTNPVEVLKVKVVEDVVVLNHVGEMQQRQKLRLCPQLSRLDGVEVAHCDAGKVQLSGRQNVHLHLHGIGEILVQQSVALSFTDRETVR